MHSRYQIRPINYVTLLCKQIIKLERIGNLHFFVNSVDFIATAIKKAGLKPEQVKIVCSNGKETATKNREKFASRGLTAGYLIEMPSDPIKKVNFYTSTAFEGCDIYDKYGRIYIVSDNTKAQNHR